MKRKILTLSLISVLFFLFASCDILSTINAVKGFYTEYQNFSEIYNNATTYTVLTETQLNIVETDVETILPLDSRVYFMYENGSDYLYVEHNLREEPVKSLLYESGDMYIEYDIDESNLVTPRIPSQEERFDGNTNANIFNENFDYQTVQNENKSGDRTYEFDVVLTQAINLDVLGDFMNQLQVFDQELTSLDDVICHVTVTFADEDSTIDVLAEVSDYTIEFDDTQSVTFNLTNHTVIKVPEEFAFPAIYEEPYVFLAVDNFALATKPYEVEEVINSPFFTGEGVWVQVYLTPGTYELVSDVNNPNFTASMFDADQNPLDWNPGLYSITIDTEGSYYVYIQSIMDYTGDMYFNCITDCTLPTTTEPVTTVLTTTE